MALATRPRLLLLDEPMAGMGREESERMVALLSASRAATTILLVEHDMDAVFALADRITVLVYGRVIASGTPAEIRANPDVRAAYLGDRTDAARGRAASKRPTARARSLFGIDLAVERRRGRDPARAATAWARPRRSARSWA